MNNFLKWFFYGLILTILSTLVSWIAALKIFNNVYYVSILLPVFVTLYVLFAWLIYLRATDLLKGVTSDEGKSTTIGHPDDSALDLSEPREDREGEEYRRQIKFTKINGLVVRKPLPKYQESTFNFNLTSVFLVCLPVGAFIYLPLSFYDVRNKFLNNSIFADMNRESKRKIIIKATLRWPLLKSLVYCPASARAASLSCCHFS